jgi:phosphoribosylanthranilate isomerase
MLVKICGLTTPEAVAAAVESGADALGFVFAESPRQVTPQRALELTRDVPVAVARVAVMLAPLPEQWAAVRDVFQPDWLQTEADDFAALDVPDGIGRLPVFRDRDIGPGGPSGGWPDHILFEGARSGAGVQADWEQAARIARETCVILAGGLDPENVSEAVLRVRPWGVDVSSGVESAPGVKDAVRIADFVRAVRAAEGA